MRDPDRLYKFYNELMNEHMENLPDWRFGQLMINFFHWLKLKYNHDGFYLEDDHFIKIFEEYIDYISML